MSKLKTSQGGYSLIQIAIGMIVLGIFVAAAGNSFVLYKKNKDVRTTLMNIEDVRIALQSYRERLGHYPCPSRMDIDRDNPQYGASMVCGGTPPSAYDTMPPGNCSNGICIETAIDGNSYIMTNNVNITPPARVLPNTRVRVGAVPFRELQLNEKKTIDGYGSKLLYAVTESMGNRNTFIDANGAVHIVNALGESMVDPPGSAPFIVVSSGPNGLGAYASGGQQISPCSGVVLDAENCRNFDPLSLAVPPTLPVTPPFAIYAADYRSDAGGNDSFDDVVEYFSKEDTPKWQRTDNNVEDIRALVEDGVGVNSTGVTDALVLPQKVTNFDDDNDPATAPVEYRGALRTTGELRTNEICDDTGASCFQPELLAGPPTITCTDPGEYLVGIDSGQPICEAVRVYCPNDSQPVLVGINPANGQANCIARPLNPCSGAVQVCRQATPLANQTRNSNEAAFITRPISLSGNHGQVLTATDTGSYAPNYRRGNFRCNNSVWEFVGGSSGFCSCTTPPATTRTVNFNCPGQSPSGNAAVRDETWDAPNCIWDTSGGIDYTACACPGPTTPQPAPINTSCGDGYNSGNVTETFTFNNANTVCAWEGNYSETCACDPTLEGTTNGGLRTLTTGVQCGTLSGFETFSGLAYRIQRFDGTPGTCAWQDHDWDTSGCSCDTATEHPAAAPASTCTSCQDETTPAEWVYRMQVVGGACIPGPAYQRSPAVCQDIPFRWRSTSSTPLGPPGTSPGSRPAVNGTCDCPDRGTTRTCYDETTPGSYYFYNCTCNR